VPDTLESSPAFFRRAKRDLDTLVRELGLPSHFVTITMNECGTLRGVEYGCIDDIMHHWDASFDWRDAPVECNRAFIARFEHVLQHYILHGPKILGPVADYAVRYECQGRGSLHVHMPIWLKTAADVHALDNRIVAYVPADFDVSTQSFMPPQDALLHRLYTFAIRKQQHTCRNPEGGSKGCIRDGHCKLLFPQPLHNSSTPSLRDDARRCKYYCSRECDRMTVPSLPDLGLLFDAHCNIAKVVAAEWSSYLVKYAIKSNPAGDLLHRDNDLFRLGFADVSIYQGAVATRFATTQIYQPAQLALVAAGVSTFRTSRSVKFVNVAPPEMRRLRVSKNSQYTTM
jgi:hypothetical protein